MLKNYFKSAWRNILKYRFYSIVNVVGLFAGIAFTMLIGAYVWGELQVNKNLRNASHQYILTSEWKDPNMGYNLATLGPLAKKLKEDYPALIKNYCRFDGITSFVSKGDKYFRENVQLGDSTLLKMYGFKLLYGNAATALNNPNTVVVTKEMAIKYFGKTDVVNQTINMQSYGGDKRDFLITAVLDDNTENSVIKLNEENANNFFVPASASIYFGRNKLDDWRNIQIVSFVELQDGVVAKDLERAIVQLLKQNTADAVQKNLTVLPISLPDYYRYKNNGLVNKMLYTLSFIALFILLMAIVNFINMAISSSAARVKEIGVRKVLGGVQKQIIIQFLTESAVLVLIATVLALAAYPLLQPVFEDIIGKQVPTLSSFPLNFILIPVALVLFIGLLAGAYPAFVLSSIKCVKAVKGKLSTVKERVVLRKSLVGFQFSIAIIVMVAAYIISQQLNYFFNGQLGYNKEYVVSSQVPRDWTPKGVRNMQTVRDEFATLAQVSNAALSYEIPNGNNGGQQPIYKKGADSTQATAMQAMIADQHYLDTYQIPLTAGTFFTGTSNDSGKVVLNQKAAAVLGYVTAGDAIGQQIKIAGSPETFTVAGITSDFHFGSMQNNIAPMVFFNVRYAITYRYLSFKIKPGNITASIDAIQKKWSRLLPGSSFEYTFMDDTLKHLYATEIQLKKAAYTATTLALIIVLLGVLGLISLSIQKRVKEISIRKVLGASVRHITLLFIKEFLLVILIAGIIACPIAYFIMQGWLNNYAYRINMSIQPFVWPVTALAIVTLLLIILQTLKEAMANPINNLKNE